MLKTRVSLHAGWQLQLNLSLTVFLNISASENNVEQKLGILARAFYLYVEDSGTLCYTTIAELLLD